MDNLPDNAVVVLSPEVKTPETPPISPESKNTEQRDQAIERIKTGTDKEGAFIFNSYKEMLSRDSKRGLGSLKTVANNYQEAIGLQSDNSEPGNIKMLDTMKALYRQSGLGEYQVTIEVSTPEGPARLQAIHEKMQADLASFPERAALSYMDRYIDRAVEANQKGDELVSALSERTVSRADVRRSAYEHSLSEQQLRSEEDKLLSGLHQSNERRRIFDALRAERLKAHEVELKPLTQKTEEERQEIYKTTAEKLKNELVQSYGERYGGLFDNLPETSRKQFVERVATAEENISYRAARAKEAVKTADIGNVCEESNRLRDVFLERRAIQRELTMALVEQRKVEAWKRVDQALLKMSGVSKGKVDATGAGLELMKSYARLYSERFRRTISPLTDRAGNVAGRVNEQVITRARNTLSEMGDTLAIPYREARDRLGERWRRNRNRLETINEERKHATTEARRKYYQGRHLADIQRYRAMYYVGVLGNYSRENVGKGVFDIVEGRKQGYDQKEQERLKNRREALSKLMESRRKELRDTFQEKKNKNGYYDRMAEALYRKVEFIGAPSNEQLAPPDVEISAPTDEALRPPEPIPAPENVTAPSQDREQDGQQEKSLQEKIQEAKEDDFELANIMEGQVSELVSAITAFKSDSSEANLHLLGEKLESAKVAIGEIDTILREKNKEKTTLASYLLNAKALVNLANGQARRDVFIYSDAFDAELKIQQDKDRVLREEFNRRRRPKGQQGRQQSQSSNRRAAAA